VSEDLEGYFKSRKRDKSDYHLLMASVDEKIKRMSEGVSSNISAIDNLAQVVSEL